MPNSVPRWVDWLVLAVGVGLVIFAVFSSFGCTHTTSVTWPEPGDAGVPDFSSAGPVDEDDLVEPPLYED